MGYTSDALYVFMGDLVKGREDFPFLLTCVVFIVTALRDETNG
jgi:hypothetical protein